MLGKLYGKVIFMKNNAKFRAQIIKTQPNLLILRHTKLMFFHTAASLNLSENEYIAEKDGKENPFIDFILVCQKAKVEILSLNFKSIIIILSKAHKVYTLYLYILYIHNINN